MKVVIDIPDEVAKENTPKAYFEYFGAWSSNLTKAFENAVVLPKGHGALIDRNTVQMSAEKFHSLGDLYTARWVVDIAPTVIPADKGEKE